MKNQNPTQLAMGNNEIREQRVIALTVPCTYCGAKQYEPCINKALKEPGPLTYIPAHYCRMKTAEEVNLF